MLRRWGLLLVLCVCVASLAGNVWLYLELKAKPAVSLALPAHPTPRSVPALPTDRHVVASTGGSSSPTVGQQSPRERSTPAENIRAKKTPEECSRMRLEANRAELRDPAQRQQTKEHYIVATRQGAESDGGLEDLHLSDEQLNRLYELAAEWFVQSAETIPPPRSNWPLDQNPLIAGELGDEVAQKWAKYQRETNGWFSVQEIAGRMAIEDVPLTRDQRRQMIELYTALDEERWGEVRDKGIQSPTNEAEAIEMHQGTKERNVEYRQKLLDRAAPILSPKQLDILRRDSDQRAASMERSWEYLRSEGKLVQRNANGCVTSYMP
jgi:hypothetical protein